MVLIRNMLPANYTKAPTHPPRRPPLRAPSIPPNGRRPANHPNIWSGIIAMQWTEYCQNLSAAVFHAPRQMSRAIKARELAPKFSAVVVVVVIASRNKRARTCAQRAHIVTTATRPRFFLIYFMRP